jgi:hypothetical protein
MIDRRKRRAVLQRRLRQRKQQTPQQDVVIGYVARQDTNMVCEGDACVVLGRRAAMIAMLQRHRLDPEQHTIEQAYLSQLLQAIGLGAAYAFDEEAYNRFLRPAQDAGLPLQEEDFTDPVPSGIHLVRVGYL